MDDYHSKKAKKACLFQMFLFAYCICSIFTFICRKIIQILDGYEENRVH